uniref:30S ribosomal protein S9 n=1 Tax=Rhizophora mucronata TaxID=61149 RepID=A0A2P2J5P4_RHIMU
MLSRLLPKPSHFRLLSQLSSRSQWSPSTPSFAFLFSRPLSTNHNNGNNNGNDTPQSASDTWKLSPETDDKLESFFTTEPTGNLAGISHTPPARDEESWLEEKSDDNSGDIFKGVYKDIQQEEGGGGGGGDGTGGLGGENEWLTSEEYNTWSLEEDKVSDHLFSVEETAGDALEARDENSVKAEMERKAKEKLLLEQEERELTAFLKGPNRAFGDLIAASGITDEMLDSLIALKDFEGIEGLPPLSEIEDIRYEKNTRKSTRAEIERQKQEEAAKARVRQVDEKGRAYGTGRRKCSVARVWIQPGEGNFTVNEKQFDVYFPMLDHRAALLQPFSETKTLGLWNIDCTVKGGGVTGQIGAIQLGISRALQNWEPGLRPALRNAGLLTRDARVVERKKPGKAKARKSFQWVKR